MVLLKYISVLNLCSNRNIDYHKRSHGMHVISIKPINLKLDKNVTQAFLFWAKVLASTGNQ